MSELAEQLKKIKEFIAAAAEIDQLKSSLTVLDLDSLSVLQLSEIADLLTRANLPSESRQLWQKAVQKAPQVAELRNNLGLILLILKDFEEAKAELTQALKLKPDFVQAQFNLGKVFQQLSDFQGAERAFSRVIKAGLSEPELFRRYASVLIALIKFPEAISILKKALLTYSEDFELKYLLAISYVKAGVYNAAVALLRELTAGSKSNAGLLNLLGFSLNKSGYLSEAQEYFQKAAEDSKFEFLASANLGNCLVNQGLVEQGISQLQKVVQLKSEEIKYNSMLCMSANYDYRLSRQQLKNIHDSANSCFTKSISISPKKHSKIKIAYISGDFKLHSVAYFMKALFEFRSKDKFEIVIFSDAGRIDSVGAWFKSKSDLWVDSLAMKDSDLVKLVRENEIDIAFDLAGHTEGSRLSCFAERLAPLQISYLGYPNTSGLEAMDYRITDSLSDPAGSEQFYSEKLLRLDPSFLCYTALVKAPDPLNPAFINNNFITFGSFNTLAKINSQVIEIWAKIIKAVPESRLLLKAAGFKDEGCRQRVELEFEKHAVSKSRLTLLPHTGEWFKHMQQYSNIDIALDTFPYNGTTTTFEALSMGVPAIVITGDRHSARVGYSILSNLELKELIADGIDSYVKIAVALAANREQISYYRQNLPDLLKKSILMDGSSFARKFEHLITLI